MKAKEVGDLINAALDALDLLRDDEPPETLMRAYLNHAYVRLVRAAEEHVRLTGGKMATRAEHDAEQLHRSLTAARPRAVRPTKPSAKPALRLIRNEPKE